LCCIAILRWSPNLSTTTIRLPEDLKARVAAAAERYGTTAHSFILEAIAEKADQAERRADFRDVAKKRYADLVASGKTIPWKKMRGYLEDRIAGKTVTRPVAKKLAR
jgi:predicted transcriptional regulator